MRTKPRPLILRDGTTLIVRAAQPADVDALEAFIERLDVERATTACDTSKPERQFCLLALRTLEGEERVVGAAEYTVVEDGCASASLGVDESFRGLGLATGLMRRLALTAAHHDVRVLRAKAQSVALLDVLRKSGIPQLETGGQETPGEETVSFDLGAVPTSRLAQPEEPRGTDPTRTREEPFPRTGLRRQPQGGFHWFHALLPVDCRPAPHGRAGHRARPKEPRTRRHR